MTLISIIVNRWVKKDKNNTNAPSTNQHPLEQQVKRAKKNIEARNELIKQYKPFMLKVTSKVCKQYINQSRDEYSVALEAFNEAIDKYESAQGSHFLSFSEMVIRRRVIDYIRKETRQTRDVLLENNRSDEEEEHTESLAQVRASIDRFEREQEQAKRRQDILDYQKLLQSFDVSFSELVECSPKHVDARDNAKCVAKALVSDQELVDFLLKKKQLPMKQLLKKVECSRKTVERNRKYIIAVALIHIGQFESLRSYIEPEQIENWKEG